MISFKHQERIHAPVEDAFEFGLNPDNWVRHIPGLDEYDVIEETEDSTRIRLPYQLLWIPMEFEIEMRTVEPNRHIAVDFESEWMAGETNYYYSEIKEGTLLESEATYDFGDSILSKLLAPVLRTAISRKIPRAAREEKRLIEAKAADNDSEWASPVTEFS